MRSRRNPTAKTTAEEGKIYKCSKAYSGQYLENYTGHHMTVYAVRWNPFRERCFLSCIAGWTVKL
ncbi:hypothetical protein H310_12337 [Aphanomyces invadans]|uniref:Uncharacterized protein n=1 Tax=Aphanomyces invadans TaxID=157072 RepID=A0A024TJI5_9STRA|nr:hypothetical protein H310_12337 [Aphanomyces invadans]ETV93771.1 hypothetical protein H310_12337 [Aphanomyces invadans]|eukprot:XP_008877580.1 hypothetical protein H310_12337 [Aphanomyces invadans]